MIIEERRSSPAAVARVIALWVRYNPGAWRPDKEIARATTDYGSDAMCFGIEQVADRGEELTVEVVRKVAALFSERHHKSERDHAGKRKDFDDAQK